MKLDRQCMSGTWMTLLGSTATVAIVNSADSSGKTPCFCDCHAGDNGKDTRAKMYASMNHTDFDRKAGTKDRYTARRAARATGGRYVAPPRGRCPVPVGYAGGGCPVPGPVVGVGALGVG